MKTGREREEAVAGIVLARWHHGQKIRDLAGARDSRPTATIFNGNGTGRKRRSMRTHLAASRGGLRVRGGVERMAACGYGGARRRRGCGLR